MTKTQLLAENAALREEIAALKRQLAAPAELPYSEFVGRFRQLYYKEKARQELRGVVCIFTRDLTAQFLVENEGVSGDLVCRYLARLKAERTVFTIVEKRDELIRWVE